MSAKPILVTQGFTITFEAKPITTPAIKKAFMAIHGWGEDELQRMGFYSFFVASVSAWKDGVELATEHIGPCCYKKPSDFYTEYKDFHFADMVEKTVANARRSP